MKTPFLQIKKHSVRLLMGIGAVFGITACSGIRSCHGPYETVYGPPPGVDSIVDSIEVLEDVYGPPVELIDSVETTVVNEPEEPKL